MAKLQGFCGLDCGECEAYLATQASDGGGLKKVAEKWSAQYGCKDLTPDMCVCDGCSSGKRLSSAHAATCAVRLCASSRGVQTCAHCPDYCCDTLKGFFTFAPILKDKLEAIRSMTDKSAM